jgi:5'-nucleotidase
MGKLMAKRVFIDMDGVIVNFDGFMASRKLSAEQVKVTQGAYLDMDPMPGAIEGVRKIIAMGFDVFVATKPPTGVAHAYAAKAQWIFDHLPELSRKVIITSDKGLLGDELDFLIDDRIHKANCDQFKGTLYEVTKTMDWDFIVGLMQFESDLIARREAAK